MLNWETRPVVKEDGIFLNKEIDKYANEVLLPEMKKVFLILLLKKHIIGEIIAFDRIKNLKHVNLFQVLQATILEQLFLLEQKLVYFKK